MEDSTDSNIIETSYFTSYKTKKYTKTTKMAYAVSLFLSS